VCEDFILEILWICVYVCACMRVANCVCVRETRANDCVHVHVRVRVRVCVCVCMRVRVHVSVRVHVCTGHGRRFYNRDVAKPPRRRPELG